MSVTISPKPSLQDSGTSFIKWLFGVHVLIWFSGDKLVLSLDVVTCSLMASLAWPYF